MGKINVLDFEIANLIAAGEVVDRPASVVKELLENSIDSGADRITAEIKNGGISLIRVSDNGCGMSAEDMPVAIKRHATSKIKSKEDLASIITLGFRGEALAAISSVSNITIISKPADARSGHILTASGGSVTDISEVGAADGTTVVVENLFGNVPARRKFLKKDSTEAMAVSALVEKVAMSRPDISFALIIDGEEKFRTQGEGNLLHTLYTILGRDFASKLIEVSGDSDGIKVSGYIGRSDNVRGNRNYQNVFINGRFVKSKTVTAALERAYTSFIAPEKFPVCAIFIEINPAFVDVNVHPAKLEVKFSDERAVFESVYHTVRTALESAAYRPEAEISKDSRRQQNTYSQLKVGSSANVDAYNRVKDGGMMYFSNSEPPAYSVHGEKNKNEPPYISAPTSQHSNFGKTPGKIQGRERQLLGPEESVITIREAFGSMSMKNIQNRADTEETETEKLSPVHDGDYRIVGEIYNCYIIAEYRGEVMLIDKHAAHERIIFEQLKESRGKDGRIGSQTLIVPLEITLTGEEIAAVKEYRDDFIAVGFDILPEIGDKTVTVTAIPDATEISDAKDIFIKMAGELSDGTGNPELNDSIRREKALYQIACKAAVKGGRVYDRSVIDWIVSRLIEYPEIIVCPHGRPVAVKLTKNELDKLFERIK